MKSRGRQLLGLTRREFSSTSGRYNLEDFERKSLMRIDDCTKDELFGLLSLSRDLKDLHLSNGLANNHKPFLGKSVASIFQKRSTRTRISTETGMQLLGGHSLFLSSEDIQLGVNESIRDSAAVISGFNDIILARVFGHEVVTELAKHSKVPVINALSDLHHPLQTLADLMVLQETFGANLEKSKGSDDKIKVAYVGDGNNVAHDLLLGCALAGLDCSVVTPEGYGIDTTISSDIKALSAISGSSFVETTEMGPALEKADVIATDTWVSMGQEEESKQRIAAFEGYQVTEKLAKSNGASENWKFLHCLPRHQEEVDDEVFYGPRSLVFPEAHNRMYTVMAVMLAMLGKSDFKF